MTGGRRGIIRVALLAALSVIFAAMTGSVAAEAAVSGGNPSSTSVGASPRGVAYSPNGMHLYVANFGSGTVTDIDPPTGQVLGTIATTGVEPSSVVFSPDSRTAYVASWTDGEVSVIDVASQTETQSFTVLGVASDLAISPDGTMLFVTEYLNNSLSVYDVTGSIPVATAMVSVGQNPTSVAVSAQGDLVYVANYGSSTFSTIDIATNSVVGTTLTGTNPWDIAVSPDGAWVAISHETSHEIHLHEVATSTSTVIPLTSESYGVTFSPDGTHLFATSYVSNTVAQIELVTGFPFIAHTLSIPGSGPDGITLSPDGCQVAISGSVGDVVQFLDASPCLGSPLPLIDYAASSELLADTGSDGVSTLAWTAGAVLAVMAGGAILLMRRRI